MSISPSLPVKRSAYHFWVCPRYLPPQACADDLARDVVGEPLVDLAELLDRADVGLLVELAQRRRPRVLALVDAALRHLPGVRVVDVFGPVEAAPDEHQTLAVEHQCRRTGGRAGLRTRAWDAALAAAHQSRGCGSTNRGSAGLERECGRSHRHAAGDALRSCARSRSAEPRRRRPIAKPRRRAVAAHRRLGDRGDGARAPPSAAAAARHDVGSSERRLPIAQHRHRASAR